MAVNEVGDVCGTFYPASSNNGRDAFRANFGAPIIILTLLTNKHHAAFARGINLQRQCVGDVYDTRKGQRAVLWQPDGSASHFFWPATIAADINPITKIFFMLTNYLLSCCCVFLFSNSTMALPIASPMSM